MFALKSLTAILALGVFSATAAPANDVVGAKAVVAGRQNRVSVLACEHIDWRGACTTFSTIAGACCKSETAIPPGDPVPKEERRLTSNDPSPSQRSQGLERPD